MERKKRWEKTPHIRPASPEERGTSGKKRILNEQEEDMREAQEFFISSNVLKGRIQKIIRKVGEGNQSRVYSAIQSRTGKTVTVKMVKHVLERNFADINRKVRSLQNLSHPNIAGLIDFIPDLENGRSYILMDYVEGKGLNVALREEGPFSQGLALDWTWEILDALNYLHEKNHIHGDIRLSNIVRRPDNSICLIDFSYLFKDDSEAEVPSSNNPNEPHPKDLGNIFDEQYDPELFQREKSEDLYHLGAALYQLLTGVRPNKQMSREAKIEALREYHVTTPVINLLLKALSDNPEERYQSAEEMRADLEALPLRDRRRKSYLWSRFFIAISASLLFFIGFAALRVGQYQTMRMGEKERSILEATDAMARGNYTLALRCAMDATSRDTLDPPCSTAARKVLADILGAYDLNENFKPLHSAAELRGKPIRAKLSPDGTRMAVLVEDTVAVPSVKRIQVFETRNGKELASSPMLAANSIQSDFIFPDSDTLLYAGRDGLTKYSLADGAVLWSGLPATSVALSGDGLIAATVNQTDSSAYLYDMETGERVELPFDERGSDKGRRQKALRASTERNSERNLFVLDEEGKNLAVSFSDGEVKIYRFAVPGHPDSGLEILNVYPHSDYTHFEGGFYGSFFFCAAWGAFSSGYIQSEFILVNAAQSVSENGNAAFYDTKLGYEPTHAQADENGVYYSMGNVIHFVVGPDLEIQQEMAVADSAISLLSVDNGKIVAVTENETVSVWKEDGNWKREVSQRTEYDIVALSGDYLLLAHSDRLFLSVLAWEKDFLISHDGFQKAVDRIPYDSDFQHYQFSVAQDGATALLYRLNDFRNTDLFRIYAPGSEIQLIRQKNVSDMADIDSLEYLRNTETAEGERECLKVRYADGEEAFYSVKDGSALTLNNEASDSAESGRVITTADYVVSYRSRGFVEIRDKASGKLLHTQEEGVLSDATQYRDFLNLSLIDNENRTKSLLLTKEMEIAAEIPLPSMLLPDGSLYIDDLDGHLWKGRVFTLEELCSWAENRGTEAE